jgi:hypothetical protein
MPNPLGYYYYLRQDIDGLIPAPRRPTPNRTVPKRDSQDRRQSLGLLLMSAAICVPVVLTGVVAFALKLLA